MSAGLGSLLQLLLWSGAALILLAALTLVATYRPRAYLVLVATTYVASQWRQSVSEAGAVALAIPFGSVNVDALDVLATVAAVAVALAALRGTRPTWNGVDRAVAGLTFLATLGVARWVLVLGVEPGVNGWRTIIYAFCLYWWARILLRGTLDKLLTSLGVLTASAQAYGYATTGFAFGAVLVDGQYFDARPVHAQSALLIVVALTVVMASRDLRSGWRLALGLALGLSALVSLHRSVWVGLLAALAVWGLQRDGLGTTTVTRAVRLVPLAFVAVVVIAVGRLSSDLSQASQSDATLLWRVDLWVERLTRERSLIEWFLGGVAIPDSERDLGSFVGTAHNMYVDVLEMFGLVGLVLLVVAAYRSWRLAGGSVVWFRPALAAVLAFGLFYPWPAWAWVLIAYGVSVEVTSSLPTRSVPPNRTRRGSSETPSFDGFRRPAVNP